MQKQSSNTVSLIVVCMLGILINCSTDNNLYSGTIEVTNGEAVVVIDRKGNPLSGVEGKLFEITINSDGDSITSLYSAVSDDSGTLEFMDVPEGKYTLVCSEQTQNIASANSRLQKNDLIKQEPIVLDDIVTIIGRIVNDSIENFDSITIVIPGTGAQASVNSDGFYTVKGVPVGTYDITFIWNDTINYLPVTVSASDNDTVYIPDIQLFGSTGASVKEYSFFDYEVSTALSITTRKYKSTNEPEWYDGVDFTSATVYSTESDSLEEDTAVAKQILLISETDGGKITDDILVSEHLERMGITVFFIDQDSLTFDDTLGMDGVYISYHISSLTFPEWIGSLKKPVVVCEGQLYVLFSMATKTGQKLKSDVQKILLTDDSKTHPITEGFSDTIIVSTDSKADFQYGKPPSDRATILATDLSDTTLALIFVYNAGDLMVGTSVAPDKRVGYYTKTLSYFFATDDAWKLFDRMVYWAFGY